MNREVVYDMWISENGRIFEEYDKIVSGMTENGDWIYISKDVTLINGEYFQSSEYWSRKRAGKQIFRKFEVYYR